MAEFEEPPPLFRAKRYRMLAQNARREAARATGSLQASYLLTAESWDKLAADLEGDVGWVEQKSKRAT